MSGDGRQVARGSYGECAESTKEGGKDAEASPVPGNEEETSSGAEDENEAHPVADNDEEAPPADEDEIEVAPLDEDGEETPPAVEGDHEGASKGSANSGEEKRHRQGCSHVCGRTMGLHTTIQDDSIHETAGRHVSPVMFKNISQASFMHHGGMESPSPEQARGSMFALHGEQYGYDTDDDERGIASMYSDCDGDEIVGSLGEKAKATREQKTRSAACAGAPAAKQNNPKPSCNPSSPPPPPPLSDPESHVRPSGMAYLQLPLATPSRSSLPRSRSASCSSVQETAGARKRARTSSAVDATTRDRTSSRSIAATIQAAFDLFSTDASASCLRPAHPPTDARPKPPAVAVLRGIRDGARYVFIVSSEVTSDGSGWLLTTHRTESDGSQYMCWDERAMATKDAASHARRALTHVLPAVEFDNVTVEDNTARVHVDVYSHDSWPYALATAVLLQLNNIIGKGGGASHSLAAPICADAIAGAARLAKSLHGASPSTPGQRRNGDMVRLLNTLPPFVATLMPDSPASAASTTSSILVDIHSSLQSSMLSWQTTIDAHVRAYAKYAQDLQTYITTTNLIRQTAVVCSEAVCGRHVAEHEQRIAAFTKRFNDAKGLLDSMDPDHSCRGDVKRMVQSAASQVESMSGPRPPSSHQLALDSLGDDLACQAVDLEDELRRVQGARDDAVKKQAFIHHWVQSDASS
ncbi:hypothetical protein AC579_1146 [Pseudocercospora musae]|uniref:Uncharacterized protein n=1 Tax=Pseudocercospora musae TaxID=113226 RepID=A0A139H3W5_9PEZI|nr:hypothetical protein AC579_1146 [Pseudocercospora musae]